MKIVYIEANADELKANRTLIEAIQDVVKGIVDTFNTPISDEFENAINEGKFEDIEGSEEVNGTNRSDYVSNKRLCHRPDGGQ